MPLFLQDFITATYGYRLKKKVFQKKYKQIYAEIEKSQWFSSKKLLKLQNEKLVNFIKYSAKHVPYYRNLLNQLSLNADDFCHTNDILKIPLLDKETVRNNSLSLVSDSDKQQFSKIINVHTSGTTGKGLHLKLSFDAWQREYAFRYLHLSWAGIYPGMKMAYLAGHPVADPLRTKPPFWAYDKINNSLYFSSQHISPKNMPAYLKKLNSFQPELIRGYPSSVYLIACGILDNGEKKIRPKAVFTNSETLLDQQRYIIEEAFHCKVYNWYGNAEQVGNIVECEHGNLHLKQEHSYIEFLREDGSPASPGEMAEMVCTGFNNEAMPLIRYRVGDMAVFSNDSCNCGRGGIIIEKIIGRVEDIVVTPDGRHIGRLDHLFKDMLNVKEAQIIQESIESLNIHIVKRDQFNESDMQKLREEAKLRLGNGIKINISFVNHLEREPSGKLRFVISKINPSDRLYSH
jgi:phenylacetate-CoA ligase